MILCKNDDGLYVVPLGSVEENFFELLGLSLREGNTVKLGIKDVAESSEHVADLKIRID
jgi:hypothetical protein